MRSAMREQGADVTPVDVGAGGHDASMLAAVPHLNGPRELEVEGR